MGPDGRAPDECGLGIVPSEAEARRPHPRLRDHPHHPRAHQCERYPGCALGPSAVQLARGALPAAHRSRRGLALSAIDGAAARWRGDSRRHERWAPLREPRCWLWRCRRGAPVDGAAAPLSSLRESASHPTRHRVALGEGCAGDPLSALGHGFGLAGRVACRVAGTRLCSGFFPSYKAKYSSTHIVHCERSSKGSCHLVRVVCFITV
jgi:hypothetical protein